MITCIIHGTEMHVVDHPIRPMKYLECADCYEEWWAAGMGDAYCLLQDISTFMNQTRDEQPPGLSLCRS